MKLGMPYFFSLVKTLFFNRFSIHLATILYDSTIRSYYNRKFNKKFHEQIKNSPQDLQKVQNKIKKIEDLQNPDDTITLFNELYTDYEFDQAETGILKGLQGFPDWSPSLATMLYKEKDDCDGMAVVWKHLGKKYCMLQQYQLLDIDTYSHIYYGHGFLKTLSEMHVMCIARVEEAGFSYILFDYDTITTCPSLEDIKEYYTKNYIQSLVPNPDPDKVCLVRLSEPKSIML